MYLAMARQIVEHKTVAYPIFRGADSEPPPLAPMLTLIVIGRMVVHKYDRAHCLREVCSVIASMGGQ